MRRPRISIAGIIVLVAVLAVDLVVMRAGIAACRGAIRHDLSLCYSWVPDRQHLPKDEPVYADYVSILDGDCISEVLDLLTAGVTPMASLLGLGVVMLLRSLVLRSQCSPFLLGFVASGSAALSAYVACCVLATEWIDRYAVPASNLVLFQPAQIIGRGISDEIRQAISSAVGIFVLGLPQVLLALLGGMLNERKLRVALMILPHTEVDSETATAAT